MRVIYLFSRDSPSSGGSIRVGQTLAKGIQKLGVEVDACFAYGGPGPIGESSEVPCHYLGLEKWSDLKYWPRLRRHVRHLKPDIIHWVDAVSWMLLASAWFRSKRVVHVHGAVPWEVLPNRDRFLWELWRRLSDLFVCITEGSRKSLLIDGWTRPERTAVVYNAIDCDWFRARPGRQEARRRLGLPLDVKMVGMICRLVEARCCDDLLRILHLLPSQWHALFVGDGKDRPVLQNLARKLDVQDRAWFSGWQDDVRPAYSALDAYVTLPLYDSFGMATAEAMFCGVPVFGLEGGGEYTEPENPLVLPENSVFLKRRNRMNYEDLEDSTVLAELAERIRAYGEEPSAFDEQIQRAQGHVETRFSMETQAKAMLQVYEQILGSSQSRVSGKSGILENEK